MGSPILDFFHLAYVPSLSPTPVTSLDKASLTGLLGGVDSSANRSTGVHNIRPLAIRQASSVKLYRCRNLHEHNVARKSDAHHTGLNDACDCCCCHVEKYLDHGPLPSSQQHAGNELVMNHVEGERPMLAILTPPSLTRKYIEAGSSIGNFGGINNLLEDQSQNNLQLNLNGHQQGDDNKAAEIELLKSIHPCLIHEQPSHKIHNNGNELAKINEDANGRNQDVHEKDLTNCVRQDLKIFAIIMCENYSDCANNFPADIVLLEPQNSPPSKCSSQTHSFNNSSSHQLLSHYSNLINHETASNAPWAVLKAFLISSLSLLPLSSNGSSATTDNKIHTPFRKIAALPCCPVCLNRIDPRILGLPDLTTQQKCSQWCSTPSIDHNNDSRHSCVNEMKLLPWPSPSHCTACQVICQRDFSSGSGTRVDHSNMQLSPPSATAAATGLASGAESQTSSLLAKTNAVTPLLLHNDDNETNLNTDSNGSLSPLLPHPTSFSTPTQLQCHRCGMANTLWVCLTCGAVGCGRYTLKHAEEHYKMVGHPYSLELATMRVWDYDNGRFAHRRDLVDCPVLSMKWGGLLPLGEHDLGLRRGIYSPTTSAATSSPVARPHNQSDSNSFSENHDDLRWDKGNNENSQYGGTSLQHLNSQLMGESVSCHSAANSAATAAAAKQISSPPKKGIMISQEYEALLQSALEDQSQHFEGEISHLRAELASSRMQHVQHISDRESREIHALRADSDRLRQEAEQFTSALLEVQTEEAKHRAMSQRLLREQSIAKELLEKLRKEARQIHESRGQQMEDLELQIADLAANLRMRSQIANDEELSQAQIFGTAGGGETGGKGGKNQRGKKSRRLFRRKN